MALALESEGRCVITVEALDVDGATVDASGIHPNLRALVRAYGITPDLLTGHTLVQFCPQILAWLRMTELAKLDTAVSILEAYGLRQKLDGNTAQIASSARKPCRL